MLQIKFTLNKISTILYKGDIVMLKKAWVHIRASMKFIMLFVIATFLIVIAVAFLYKPIYSVSINGEHVGYCGDKSKLQERINNYIENGDGENVAFVQIENLPEYKLCLLKKGIVTNDDEIYNKVAESGITYYRYYAILENSEEKYYVHNFEEAEKIVNSLKNKKSSNIDKISIAEKYETELKDFISTEEAISKLYVEPVKKVTVAKTNSTKYAATGSVVTANKTSSGKVSLGITLARPISGTITSRFGRRSSGNHTGLDIAAPYGTKIKAAASGTITFSGYKGLLGNLIVISHGNGVQTYYAHCSALYGKVGQSVKQGEVIAAVGSTGNSTGNHLHLEVRVNGVAYNPQNYVY